MGIDLPYVTKVCFLRIFFSTKKYHVTRLNLSHNTDLDRDNRELGVPSENCWLNAPFILT